MNRVIIFIIVLLVVACGSSKQTVNQSIKANKPFLIYKTRADYYNMIPVIMNADKTKIISYPSPSDVMVDGKLMLPVRLKNGYLLDIRGIAANVAFTSFTYEDYVNLDAAPSINILMSSIIDDDPILELYDCKNLPDIKHDNDKINALIIERFKKCEKIK